MSELKEQPPPQSVSLADYLKTTPQVMQNPDYRPPKEGARYGSLQRGDEVGRPIIGPDQPILGGVFPLPGNNWLVCDFTSQSGENAVLTEHLYQQVKEEVIKKNPLKEKLKSIYDETNKRLPNNPERLRDVSRKRLAIEWFLPTRGADARVRILTVGLMIERMITEGYLSGQVSCDGEVRTEPDGKDCSRLRLKYQVGDNQFIIEDMAIEQTTPRSALTTSSHFEKYSQLAELEPVNEDSFFVVNETGKQCDLEPYLGKQQLQVEDVLVFGLNNEAVVVLYDVYDPRKKIQKWKL